MATQAQPQYNTQIISNGSKWAGQAPDPIELLLERLSQYPLDPAFLSNRGEGTPYQHVNEGSDAVTFAGNFTTFSGVFRIVTNDPALVAELVARIEANETVKAWRAEHAGPKKSYYGTFSAIRDRHKATAAAAPGVDIPGLFELAERAHQGTSFSPEKRAESYTVENKAHLAADLGKIHAAGAAAGADAERIQAAADRYQAGFVSKLNAWLYAKSRCISTMITGGSNFPVRRAEKANNSEHNRVNEFIEYYEKGLARAIKSLSTPPTMQEQADKYAREAAQLEKAQELMKAGNRIIRAAKGADCTEKLRAAGLSEKLAAEAQKVMYGRQGFPAWMLTNNLANIKRVKARAEEVAAKAAAQQQASAEATAATARTFELNGQPGEVVVNAEVDRVQLIFEGKPDAATITQLKRNGFKWSPRFGAWQRQDTLNGRHTVRQLTGVDLNAPATVATIEQPATEPEQLAEVEPVQQLVAEQPTRYTLSAEVSQHLRELKQKRQAPEPVQQLVAEAEPAGLECLNCCTEYEPTATSAPGFCQYCTENNLTPPAEAPAAVETDPDAAKHFHPTLKYNQLSTWQRKQYSHAQQPAQFDLFSQAPEPVQQLVAEAEPVAPCVALEPAAVGEAVALEIDFNRLVLLADYHGPATLDQVQRLPEWHELKAQPAPAPAAPQLEHSRPAAEGWHVIERAADVAPEHVAQLEQLRELVQALPVAGRHPSLYEVVQLAQLLPAGSPYHVEGRPDGLAISYGRAEVLRLAPAGSWPPPGSNYAPPRSTSAAPIGSGYAPPQVAPVRPASRAQFRLVQGGFEIYLPAPRGKP